MDDTGKCPKCGFARQPESLDCPACGIVYARFRPDRPRTPEKLFDGGSAFGAEAAPVVDDGLYNPYQPPSASVVGSPGYGGEVLELADRGTRLVSRFVDGATYMGVGLVFLVPVLLSAANPEDTTLTIVGAVLAAVAALGLLGYNLYLLSQTGQTIGRRAMKIRIVRTNGERVGLGRLILLRYLAPQLIGVIPIAGAGFGLANVLFIFREDRRCIHDHFADTIVVKA